jgi:hypothetical protein
MDAIDRFIFVGPADTGMVGRTGTVITEDGPDTFVAFDFEPNHHRFVVTDQIAPQGSVQIRGLSLSFCVRDLVKRYVNILDVGLITIGTNCHTETEWEAMLDEYATTYWREFPAEARAVVNLLLFDGKIEQPRCHGGCPPNIAKEGGHWIAH